MPALNFVRANVCLVCGDDNRTCDCMFACKTCCEDSRTCSCAHKCEFCGYDSRECNCAEHYCDVCKKPHEFYEFCHCYDDYIEWDRTNELHNNEFNDDCEDHFDDGWYDDDMWSHHNQDEGEEDELVREELHLQMNGLTYSDMCELMKETHPDIFETNEHPYTAFICPVCDCFLGTGHGCWNCTGYNLRSSDSDLIVSCDYDTYDEERKSRRRRLKRFDTLKRDKQKRGYYNEQKNNSKRKVFSEFSDVLSRHMSMRGFHDTCHGCDCNIYSCECDGSCYDYSDDHGDSICHICYDYIEYCRCGVLDLADDFHDID